MPPQRAPAPPTWPSRPTSRRPPLAEETTLRSRRTLPVCPQARHPPWSGAGLEVRGSSLAAQGATVASMQVAEARSTGRGR